MPMPNWFRYLNKYTFNQVVKRRGSWPVIMHVGRTAGSSYATPLHPTPTEDGYVFILMYGRHSDWVQNILTSGSASLSLDGATIELANPRIITRPEALEVVTAPLEEPASFLKVTEYLLMDRLGTSKPTETV